MPVSERFTDEGGLTRGQLLHRGVAASLAVGAAGVFADEALGAKHAIEMSRLRDGMADPAGIHRFRIRVPKAQLVALRQRIAATRWPSMELVADRSQGVQLATAQALADYRLTWHRWRAFERRLNALGLRAFARRAEREPLATGEHARKHIVETRGDLTAQDAHIRRHAADGLSNITPRRSSLDGAIAYLDAAQIDVAVPSISTPSAAAERGDLP